MPNASVFLNVPYDEDFQPFFLAYIVGITGFGLLPRAALEVQSSTQRINRILEVLHGCDFSIHDMSRSGSRFNMPFELGLAYHHAQSGNHSSFIFADHYRDFETRLSDLKGIDIYEHGNDFRNIFSSLTAAFISQESVPSVVDMNAVYELVNDSKEEILVAAGSQTLFHPRVFTELVFASISIWRTRQVKKRSSQP